MEVAVRAYAVPYRSARPRRRVAATDLGPSPWTLIFDTETTADAGQSLRVGCYQLRCRDRLREEGLFYEPASLTVHERDLFRSYADEHGLRLLTRDELAEEVFLKTAWDRRGLIVGHNLPFDLARVSIANRPCQSRDKSMRGGFTLTISRNAKRSHVQIRKTNSGAAFIRLTIPAGVNPELRNRGRGGGVENHHGYFLDTATLGGAMFGGRPSLKKLAVLLATETRKQDAKHGEILDARYLRYLRTDVQVTWECWQRLNLRYARYQLPAPPWQIHSEAGIGKAHLAKMQLTPFSDLNRWPDEVTAAVMESYYGGRAECAIRRVPVPGVYVDFASQYPTVFALQGLHRFLVAERVDWIREDPAPAQRLLDSVTLDDVLTRRLWEALPMLVLVQPDGDRLPTRARYARSGQAAGGTFNLGLPLRTGGPAQWYTLADCIASKLMTDKAPRVLGSLRFSAEGIQPGLTAIDVAGDPRYRVDPQSEDLIARLVQLRKRVRADQKRAEEAGNVTPAARFEAIQQAMKATANSTAYGSPIEMNPIEHRKGAWVNIHLPDGGSYRTRVSRTEQPGKWFHPLIATLVAAGGRLLLASAMALVAERGGQFAFCDTDSLFIVATRGGELIPCPGGPHRTPDGQQAIRALPWDAVSEITERFTSLSAYGDSASILETETENFDDETGEQRQIECLAIAAKRYAMFTRAKDGRPVLLGRAGKLKRSEHGLGHLLSPHAPDPEARESVWLDEWWQHLLEIELGYDSPRPAWFDEPAVGRLAVGSPRELRAFARYNAGRPYAERVKPWGFLAVAYPVTHERARPDGLRCLIAPFERDPARRIAMDWIDRDHPERPGQRIRTSQPHALHGDSTVVLSYGDYFDQYRLHPETKATAPADGNTCHTWTRGLLLPQHVRATALLRVAKESNRLADSHQPAEDEHGQVIEYPRPSRKCRGCDAMVDGRRHWCSEACRKAHWRRKRAS
jgi:hypothetical protein